MEEVACSGCNAEPGDPYETEADLELCGWEFTEYGPLCPECSVGTRPSQGTAGIEALAEAIGSETKDK